MSSGAMPIHSTAKLRTSAPSCQEEFSVFEEGLLLLQKTAIVDASDKKTALVDASDKKTVKHAGDECWSPCGDKGGYCSWCGEGNACCRRGFNHDPPECKDAYYFRSEYVHQCVFVEKDLALTEKRVEQRMQEATAGVAKAIADAKRAEKVAAEEVAHAEKEDAHAEKDDEAKVAAKQITAQTAAGEKAEMVAEKTPPSELADELAALKQIAAERKIEAGAAALAASKRSEKAAAEDVLVANAPGSDTAHAENVFVQKAEEKKVVHPQALVEQAPVEKRETAVPRFTPSQLADELAALKQAAAEIAAARETVVQKTSAENAVEESAGFKRLAAEKAIAGQRKEAAEDSAVNSQGSTAETEKGASGSSLRESPEGMAADKEASPHLQDQAGESASSNKATAVDASAKAGLSLNDDITAVEKAAVLAQQIVAAEKATEKVPAPTAHLEKLLADQMAIEKHAAELAAARKQALVDAQQVEDAISENLGRWKVPTAAEKLRVMKGIQERHSMEQHRSSIDQAAWQARIEQEATAKLAFERAMAEEAAAKLALERATAEASHLDAAQKRAIVAETKVSDKVAAKKAPDVMDAGAGKETKREGLLQAALQALSEQKALEAASVERMATNITRVATNITKEAATVKRATTNFTRVATNMSRVVADTSRVAADMTRVAANTAASTAKVAADTTRVETNMITAAMAADMTGEAVTALRTAANMTRMQANVTRAASNTEAITTVTWRGVFEVTFCSLTSVFIMFFFAQRHKDKGEAFKDSIGSDEPCVIGPPKHKSQPPALLPFNDVGNGGSLEQLFEKGKAFSLPPADSLSDAADEFFDAESDPDTAESDLDEEPPVLPASSWRCQCSKRQPKIHEPIGRCDCHSPIAC